METKGEVNSFGVICRIFGVILLILGGMDCMLAWRGGFHIHALYIGLMVAGVLLFVIGSIQKKGP